MPPKQPLPPGGPTVSTIIYSGSIPAKRYLVEAMPNMTQAEMATATRLIRYSNSLIAPLAPIASIASIAFIAFNSLYSFYSFYNLYSFYSLYSLYSFYSSHGSVPIATTAKEKGVPETGTPHIAKAGRLANLVRTVADDYRIDFRLMAILGTELLLRIGDEFVVNLIFDKVDGATAETTAHDTAAGDSVLTCDVDEIVEFFAADLIFL